MSGDEAYQIIAQSAWEATQVLETQLLTASLGKSNKKTETQSSCHCIQWPGLRIWLKLEDRKEQMPAWTHPLSQGWLNMYSSKTRAILEIRHQAGAVPPTQVPSWRGAWTGASGCSSGSAPFAGTSTPSAEPTYLVRSLDPGL